MKSLSEQLGLDPRARAVILHADDVGMCHAQNLGFFEVIESGTVSCGSAMVPCPWFAEASAYARRHPQIDLGVHLCLNSEFSSYRWGPVVGRSRVPTLVDGEGFFWPSPMETLERADPEEVKVELRAQIERAFAAGIDVTHLDAHMGTAMMHELLSIYLELGREFRLPVFFPRPTPKVLADVGRSEMIRELPHILEQFEHGHLLMVDRVDLRSLSFDPDRAETHYRQVISELQPGVTQLFIHPARGGEELEAITPNSWRQRDAERRIFSSPETRRWFEDANVELIGYRRVRDLLRER